MGVGGCHNKRRWAFSDCLISEVSAWWSIGIYRESEQLLFSSEICEISQIDRLEEHLTYHNWLRISEGFIKFLNVNDTWRQSLKFLVLCEYWKGHDNVLTVITVEGNSKWVLPQVLVVVASLWKSTHATLNVGATCGSIGRNLQKIDKSTVRSTGETNTSEVHGDVCLICLGFVERLLIIQNRDEVLCAGRWVVISEAELSQSVERRQWGGGRDSDVIGVYDIGTISLEWESVSKPFWNGGKPV